MSKFLCRFPRNHRNYPLIILKRKKSYSVRYSLIIIVLNWPTSLFSIITENLYTNYIQVNRLVIFTETGSTGVPGIPRVPSCVDMMALPDRSTLFGMITQIARENGLMNVSEECADILNYGLEVGLLLKTIRIIRIIIFLFDFFFLPFLFNRRILKILLEIAFKRPAQIHHHHRHHHSAIEGELSQLGIWHFLSRCHPTSLYSQEWWKKGWRW